MSDGSLDPRDGDYGKEPEDVLRDAGFILDDDGNVIGREDEGGVVIGGDGDG